MEARCSGQGFVIRSRLSLPVSATELRAPDYLHAATMLADKVIGQEAPSKVEAGETA